MEGIMMSQLNPNNHLRLGAKFKAHVYQAIVDKRGKNSAAAAYGNIYS